MVFSSEILIWITHLLPASRVLLTLNTGTHLLFHPNLREVAGTGGELPRIL